MTNPFLIKFVVFYNMGTQDPAVEQYIYVTQTPEVVVLEHLLKIKVV